MPRFRRRKEARPGEIVAAALACFAERGFAATRLDDVAAKAGVTKGTIYLYYKSKEDLFRAVVREALVPNIARAEALLEQDVPSARVLEQLLSLMMGVLTTSPIGALPKLVIAESSNFPELGRFYLETVVHRAFALIARILNRGIKRREFRTVDVESTTRCVIAPLLFAALWTHSLGRFETTPLDAEALWRAHLDLVLRGLAQSEAA